MSFHAFSLDPRTILEVGPDASSEEIHEAYRAKSKKHHPDRGGDEWAFRMVSRAYEVLRTTAAGPRGNGRVGPEPAVRSRPSEWTWGWGTRFDPTDPGRPVDPSAGVEPAAGPEWPEPTPNAAEESRSDPTRMQTVDVELIWIRFEKDGPSRLLTAGEPDDATLSVCMVLSWPEADLVDRTAAFPGTAGTLRTLIDLFERLRSDDGAVAARSRIEDGRFVGWLSYPDVLTAQDAVLTLGDSFRSQGLAIKLQTRDERIPFDWHSPPHSPVISQAS